MWNEGCRAAGSNEGKDVHVAFKLSLPESFLSRRITTYKSGCHVYAPVELCLLGHHSIELALSVQLPGGKQLLRRG